MTIKTVAGNLREQAERIKAQVADLLGKHSSLRKRNDHVMDPNGDHEWRKLAVEGHRLQARVLGAYRNYRDVVKVLIRPLSSDAATAFAEADSLVEKHLQQDRNTWCRSAQEAGKETNKCIDRMQNLLERLFCADGECLFVPDTNALLGNTRFEHWRFDGVDQFTIVLTSVTLSELDKLKIEHRNPNVQKKAESVIRQIKEFRRRGQLTEGVPVVKDKIAIRGLAIEPKVAESLPWLDPTNNDDRFLAAVVELMQQNVRSCVTIVTRDINLQNKAEFARFPFCEPPEETPSFEADAEKSRSKPP